MQTEPQPEGAGGDRLDNLELAALELLTIIERISPEEFRWQESHYDRDSRHGRELLFLMANHEWVRATSEIVDISRADAIETAIKLDIDLDQITHEAFRQRTGRFWLPVAVLPPQTWAHQQDAGPGHLDPDPFATVTDAAGDLMPMLPLADARHQMSAALAEIIVNMAVARWPGPEQDRPTATRDQRLLLSAAIYRLLRRGPARLRPAPAIPGHAAGPVADAMTPRAHQSRMDKGRQELLRLITAYFRLLRLRGHPAPAGTAPQFAPELASRAVRVLTALTESMVVVIPLPPTATPTVLTVHVPTRGLHPRQERRLTHPRTWMARPLAELEIHALLTSADADRQIQVHLPDGLSFVPDGPGQPRLDIRVQRPRPFQELSLLLSQLTGAGDSWPPPLRQCLADLARSKAAAAAETLRHFEVSPAGRESLVAAQREAATTAAWAALDELRAELGPVGGNPGSPLDPGRLTSAMERFEAQAGTLYRRTSAVRASPRSVVARTDKIEDTDQRAIPRSARIRAGLTFTDGALSATARFSGRLSLLLMAIVLVMLVAWRHLRHGALPNPEVLAIVLTLFSAIQASQMERPDRSTVRGLLSGGGNWLIGASIVPAVVLAVVLAFPWGGWVPTIWAAGCVTSQLLFQLAMSGGKHIPLRARLGQRWVFATEAPYYGHFATIRSNYWRSTTADALMIGRTAYAYMVWQQGAAPQLRPLLAWQQQDPAVPGEAANLLALLRAGTPGQATTFVVFRRQPPAGWTGPADRVTRLDLNSDRLAPMEIVTSVVDLFVGTSRAALPRAAAHPLTQVLRAAEHKLIVLDAQLPVPNPVRSRDGQLWSRIRVALRDTDDLRRLRDYLDQVLSLAQNGADGVPFELAIRAVPGPARLVLGQPQPAVPPGPGSDLILAGDLDISNLPGLAAEPADRRCWRILAICADAWSNVESDIVSALAQLRPPVELAGLTYGLMHGTAVIFVLLHEPGGHQADRPDLAGQLQQRLPRTRLHIPVNRELTREELGLAGPHPLLRVHFRWQDRPGALLDVLSALSTTLAGAQPPIQPADWTVGYVRVQVAAGRSALARLTVRVHAAAAELQAWNPGQMEEISRKVAAGASRNAVGASGAPVAQGPVISVDLIRAAEWDGHPA